MTNKNDNFQETIEKLKRYVFKRPMFALDLNPDDSLAILGSQNGISQFTIAKHHEFASDIKPPVICIADIKGSQESHGLYLMLASTARNASRSCFPSRSIG